MSVGRLAIRQQENGLAIMFNRTGKRVGTQDEAKHYGEEGVHQQIGVPATQYQG
jgi:hypothetical protein